jgi:alkanesulfonate monooxygenase SsuD/methylene tetrahydromethanopterin reductase-like flavin-dependent oxidoreductase (luciferase family)
MIHPWMFEFVTAFSGAGAADDYTWYLDQWLAAEGRGFEGIFFSEHHFVPGRYSASPNLLIAALAGRTRRLRLGTLGNVVPLYEPWRLAEEYAMLDQLSGGRLEIGYATGSGPREYLAVGMRHDDVRARFDEAVQIIDGLLENERITHSGRFWQLQDLGIAPRPLQQPAPRRWMTGMSPPSADVAARRGYAFATGFVPTGVAAQLFARYRATAQASGRSVGPAQLALRRMVVIADDAAEAKGEGQRALDTLRRIVGGDQARGVTNGGADAAAPPGAVPDAPQRRHGGGMIAEDEVISGDVAGVAAAIVEQCEQSGAGHFCAYPVNHLTRAQATRSLELWSEVNARLRAHGEASA